ncbi:MAG TPA: hypothetical protein VM737_04685 [Gemmatimonadota bacterium]|nr:hypothetical protein [Gemmatimonadota bacterium]
MRNTTRLCLVIAGGLFLSGCESEPAEEATLEIPADTIAATISLADVAGTWDMRSVPVSGDTTATVYQVIATADSWTMMFADRDPVVGVAMVSGDSVIVDAGPYESVRRDGLMVTTHAVYWLEGDRLTGKAIARYATTEADSVLHLTTEGIRAQ